MYFWSGKLFKVNFKFKKQKLAVDRDKNSEKFAINLKDKHKNRFFFHNIKFGDIDKIELKREDVKAIIFD